MSFNNLRLHGYSTFADQKYSTINVFSVTETENEDQMDGILIHIRENNQRYKKAIKHPKTETFMYLFMFANRPKLIGH